MTQTTVTANIEKITPQKAKQYLDSQETNRTVSMKSVDAYTAEILSNRWEVNGESIKFDWFNRLIDGQHRLLAIVKANKAADCLVVRGVSPQSQDTVDQGRKRSVGDVLGMHGYKYGNALAATARLLIRWENGERNFATLSHAGSSTIISAPVVREYIDRHPMLPIVTARVLNSPMNKQKLAPPRTLNVLAYLILTADPERGELFLQQLESGANLEEGSPVLTLRRYWANLRGTGRGKGQDGLFLNAGIRSWNAFARYRKLNQIAYKSTKIIPEVLGPRDRSDSPAA